MAVSLSSLLNNPTGLVPSTTAAVSAPVSKTAQFGSMLNSAIATVNQAQNDSTQAIQQFLTGQGEELHNVALATQRAELALDLGIQVRNKVVSAYQEIMKMQL